MTRLLLAVCAALARADDPTDAAPSPVERRAASTRSAACAAAVAAARRPWAPEGNARFQRDFATFKPGGLAVGFGDRCLFYASIWKGGNNAIRESLHASLPVKRLLPEHVLLSTNHAEKLEALRSSEFCAGGSYTFTFARDPLSHFISGFAEFAFVFHKHEKTISPRLANETVAALLAGRSPSEGSRLRWPVMHLNLMSGVLAEADAKPGGPRIAGSGWHLELLGRLEEAQSDWTEIMRASRIPQLERLSLAANKHTTSADPQGARAAMTAVLREDATLRRRLCELLAADYACFGYDLSRCLDGTALR